MNITLPKVIVIILTFVSTTVYAEVRGLSRNVSEIDKTAFADGVYRAVVIGIDQYNDPEHVWQPLKTAVSDATSVAHLLKDKYAFTDIKLLTNSSRREILIALKKLSDRVKPHDSVLVYYAGHGWQNDKTKEAFWVPVDAEGKDDSTFISNVRIKEKLSVIADTVNHTLLISDSCFSGTLLTASRGAVNRNFTGASQENYFRKIAMRKSVQILAAGGNEFVDDNYRGSGHSPFTYFLLNELNENTEQYIPFSTLALNIEQLVARNVEQTPQSGALRKTGDEGGQFIFKRLDVAQANSRHTVTNESKGVALKDPTPREPQDISNRNEQPKLMPLPSF